MTSVTSLDVRNLHGRLHVTLDRPAVFITGPNRAGKSSILRSLVALIHCTPKELGSQPPGMRVTAMVDGVEHVSVVGYGGKFDHMIGGIVRPPKAAQAERLAAFGEAGVWSVDSFLESSATVRSSFMATRIIGDVFTSADIERELAERQESLVDVAGLLRVDIGAPKLMDVLWSSVCEQANAAQAASLQLQRTVAQEEADRESRRLPPGTVAGWRSTAAELSEQIGRAREAQRQAREVMGRRQKTLEQQADIVARLAAMNEAPLPSTYVRDWSAEVAAAAAALHGARERHDALMREAAQASQAAREARDRAEAARHFYLSRRHDHESGVSLLRLIDAMQEILGAWPEDWRPDLRGEAEHALSALDAPPRHEDVRKAQVEFEALDAEAGRLNVAWNQVTSRQQTALSEKANAEAEHRRLQGEETKAFREGLVAQAAVARWRAGKQELEAALALISETIPDGAPTCMAEDELSALVERHRDAQTKADALNDAAQADIALATHRGQRDVAQARASRLRELRSKLEQVRSALMSRHADPVADIASDITQDVLGNTIAVRGGDVLVTDAFGETYSIDQASDGERVVIMVALSVAVRSRLPGWRAAIVDRLDALTPDLADRLCRALAAKQKAGIIDNVIIACHYEPPAATDGDMFQLIRLEARQ
jgi:hypothetical protein